jgi:hypothetical protein
MRKPHGGGARSGNAFVRLVRRFGMKNDIEHLYEMLSDVRHDIAALKLQVEWLSTPWIVRWIFNIWEFLRSPFGLWGGNRHGGDL